MKIVLSGSPPRVGVWAGGHIIDANLAVQQLLLDKRGSRDAGDQAGALAPPELNAFIAGGERTLDTTREAVDYVAAAEPAAGGQPISRRVEEVALLAPWVRGNRIACAGANYALHVAGIEAAREGSALDVAEVQRRSRESGPWGFWKVPDVVKGPEDEVAYPSRATLLDYEGEAAVIIGKPARDVSEAEARSCFWGVTLLNDWSIRNDMGQGRPMSFNLPKNFDGSTSMGPCILVGEFDPQNIAVVTKVNGQVRQDYNTDQMTWGFAEYLQFLARDFTFQPGDVLSGGTGAGTAMDSSRRGAGGKASTELFLKPGDVVEVSSPSIGMLRNRIVSKN
ncbi:MAG: fumarylacetoacetate hydrolase family protein [Chloroflexota bacterium]|nr:fumarylacetoacetate hydrolase family protein [Chloroflexota bacterium]